MPEATKTQPWKAHWPPTTTVEKGPTLGKKAGEMLEVDGQVVSDAYSNDGKGERVASVKE